MTLPMNSLIASIPPVFFGGFMHKYQAVYESNIDYDRTCQEAKVCSNVRYVGTTRKGLIQLGFKGLENAEVLISPRGKIEIFYASDSEKNACIDRLNGVLVPNTDEQLTLWSCGSFSVADRIHFLAQEHSIRHDQILNVDELASMTSCTRQELIKAMPTILSQKYPYGIELKALTLVAGCQRADPSVEQWLDSAERALRTEGFVCTDRAGWEDNQYFQFIRRINANTDAKIVVKAFLDGSIIVEARPWQLTELANNTIEEILSKYAIPYQKSIPDLEKAGNANGFVAALALAVGALVIGTALLS